MRLPGPVTDLSNRNPIVVHGEGPGLGNSLFKTNEQKLLGLILMQSLLPHTHMREPVSKK